jgi:glycosyltransferase involved in cell wall biosynthesis
VLRHDEQKSHSDLSEPVEKIFTVFTPTFNRAKTLRRVYDSLHVQSFRDFEWLIVDDGSTDDTHALIDRWQSEAGFSIRYFYQENAGKHVAVNRGVAAANGQFFLILDSDDECVPEALERFLFYWQSIPEADKPRFSGVTCLCEDEQGRLVGSPFPHSPCDSDSIEIRLRYKVKGEKWGFQRTDVMRLFPFPEVRGESQFRRLTNLFDALARKCSFSVIKGA